MPEYKIGLAVVKAIDEDSKGLDERKDFIISKIKLFNEKSLVSSFNQKHIGLGENGEDNISLTKTSLIITLYTKESLNYPGKAIRLLSELLMNSEHPDNLSDLKLDKKLFKTFKVSTIPTDNKTNTNNYIDLSNVSNSDLIKSLIDFSLDNNDYSKVKIDAIEKMKILAIESDIIKL